MRMPSASFFIEIGKTRIFEIPKVHSVVDVPERIHVSPDDVLTENYGVFFEGAIYGLATSVI